MRKLLDFLSNLERHQIHFSLARIREETIMVDIAVPGERWEVEFFADGQVEVEIFIAKPMEGEEALTRLFEKHGEVIDA